MTQESSEHMSDVYFSPDNIPSSDRAHAIQWATFTTVVIHHRPLSRGVTREVEW